MCNINSEEASKSNTINMKLVDGFTLVRTSLKNSQYTHPPIHPPFEKDNYWEGGGADTFNLSMIV